MKNEFKKTISFIDKNKRKAIIKLEITHRNGYPELTACGRYCGSSGQCQDDIKPRTEAQKEFLDFWNKYHLKDITKNEEQLTNELNRIIKTIESDEDEEQEKTIKKQMEEYGIDDNMLDACTAYLSNFNDDTDLSDFEEAYQGQYDDDEDFVMQLLEETGDIPENLPSYIHINWARTASDIMYDYFEEDGYYFRNL